MNNDNNLRKWMIMLQRLGPCPMCFTGTDVSLGNGAPSWRDLASCLCPKAPYMKQFGCNMRRWDFLLLEKGMSQSVLSGGNCVEDTGLGYVLFQNLIWKECCTHALELQARRCFCSYKSAWSCHVLLDPRREGEIGQKGGTSLVLQDLPWFLNFSLSEENWNSSEVFKS